MQKKYPVAILEVLILQRFPFGKDSTFFYFAAGENLEVQVGDVVKIPWRNGEKSGVVVKLKRMITDKEPALPGKEIKLKPITAVWEKGYFSPDLLDKLRVAAKRYFVSWNHFAKSVVDIPPARAKKGIKPNQLYLPLLGEYQKIYDQKIIAKNLVSSDTRSFVFASFSQTAGLKSILKNTLAGNRQILVIVPEKTHLIPTAGKYASLTDSFSRSTPILLGKFLPRVFSRGGWEMTRGGEPNIFIGTRSAIFAPFSNLGLIILEDGHDLSLKQWDLAPLYDIRKLLDIFYPSARKIYLSDTPRLEDFFDSPYYLSPGGIKKLAFAGFEKAVVKENPAPPAEKPPHLLVRTVDKGKSKKKIVLINTQIEKSLAREEAVISGYLVKQLTAALKKNESALLIINHSGIANLLVCADCGYVFRCPQCGKALSQLAKSCLDCRFCGFKGSAASHCPHCSGVRIVCRRYGIEKIKEALSQLKSKVGFTILETPSSQAGYAGLINFAKKNIQSGKPQVLLGYTGIISLGRALKNRLGLAAILDFDETLFYPDFRSEERTAARFYNLLAVAPRIFIQTSDPNQPFLRKIISEPYSALFPGWLKERKDFLFPPAVNIMRIDVPGDNLVEKILGELRSRREIIEALAVPVSGAARKNKYQAAIVVKYQRGVNIAPIIENLFRRFGSLRIDPDPEEL